MRLEVKKYKSEGNSPVFDLQKVYVHPKGEEEGFFLVPSEEDGQGNSMLDQWGYPNAKSMGEFFFDVWHQQKRGKDITNLRWTRWAISDSFTDTLHSIFDGDIVKIVWTEGVTDIPKTYKVEWVESIECRWVLKESTKSSEYEYLPIAEIDMQARQLKSIQYQGNIFTKKGA